MGVTEGILHLSPETKRAPAATQAGKPERDPNRPAPGIDVDAATQVVLTSLEDDKAEEIVSIDIRGKSSFADMLVIASGRSARHVGALADHVLRKLKEAGVKDVRVYFGSWNEWSRDPRLPIDAGCPPVIPSCLRPIDDAGLRRLIATGHANPGDIKTAKCRTVADGQFRNLSYCRDHAPYVVDEPEHMLGRNTGPSPAETALASLGACLSVGVQANATARGITLRTLELTLEARYPNTFVWGAGDLSRINAGFTAVDIAVTIEGDASPDALDALIAHAVAWSPIAGTMRNPVALAVTRVPR